jgi:hypothetical protein
MLYITCVSGQGGATFAASLGECSYVHCCSGLDPFQWTQTWLGGVVNKTLTELDIESLSN